jgi:prepilin-type N-terminal cleavage/methylation domain-containing protein
LEKNREAYVRQGRHIQPGARAFTLIELMVVVSIIALLAMMLAPALMRARDLTRRAMCDSNIRGLAQSNAFYAQSNDSYYVLAAPDIFVSVPGGPSACGGYYRWHGVRTEGAKPFDPAKGPLVPYIGTQGKLKVCPVSESLASQADAKDFEKGCGGYGYNASYVGGRYDKYGGAPDAAAESARSFDVVKPAETVMFTDAGMAQKSGTGRVITEYSFCEPPFFQMQPGPPGTDLSTPSIHFRHLGTACVAWVDTHVSNEKLSFTNRSYGLSAAIMQTVGVGWFGSQSNDLFDLK